MEVLSALKWRLAQVSHLFRLHMEIYICTTYQGMWTIHKPPTGTHILTPASYSWHYITFFQHPPPKKNWSTQPSPTRPTTCGTITHYGWQSVYPLGTWIHLNISWNTLKKTLAGCVTVYMYVPHLDNPGMKHMVSLFGESLFGENGYI